MVETLERVDGNEFWPGAEDPLPQDVARSAIFDSATDLLIVHLVTGQRLAIPREDLQGLAGASKDAVAHLELDGDGMAIHWPELNADHLVESLRKGIYGGKVWRLELSRQRQASGALAS